MEKDAEYRAPNFGEEACGVARRTIRSANSLLNLFDIEKLEQVNFIVEDGRFYVVKRNRRLEIPLYK